MFSSCYFTPTDMLAYWVTDKTFHKFIHHDLWESPQIHSSKLDILVRNVTVFCKSSLEVMGKMSMCKNGGEHAIKGHVSMVPGRLLSTRLNY